MDSEPRTHPIFEPAHYIYSIFLAVMKKKVDERVRTLIENGVKSRTRSLFVIVGDRGKDQVANLHYILSKAQVKARPTVLWCYNKELGFST